MNETEIQSKIILAAALIQKGIVEVEDPWDADPSKTNLQGFLRLRAAVDNLYRVLTEAK